MKAQPIRAGDALTEPVVEGTPARGLGIVTQIFLPAWKNNLVWILWELVGQRMRTCRWMGVEGVSVVSKHQAEHAIQRGRLGDFSIVRSAHIFDIKDETRVGERFAGPRLAVTTPR